MDLRDVGYWIKGKVEDVKFVGEMTKLYTELTAEAVIDCTKAITDELSGKNTIDENNRIVETINSLNVEMEKIYSSTNTLAQETKEKFDHSQSSLEMRRKITYKTTLKNFAETISLLKEVEIEELKERREIIANIQKQEMYTARISIPHEDYLSLKNIILFSTGGGLGVLFGALWKQIKLEEQLQEVRKEKLKLVAQCEKVKEDCVKVEAMISTFDLARETIVTLSMLTFKAVKNVKKIIQEVGVDYSSYTAEQKNQVMVMVNFALALNDLILVDVLDNDGNISFEFKEFCKVADHLISR